MNKIPQHKLKYQMLIKKSRLTELKHKILKTETTTKQMLIQEQNECRINKENHEKKTALSSLRNQD